jgi:hypothetical protein
MFNAVLVPNAIRQHSSPNYFGVLSRLLIPGKFIAVRIWACFPTFPMKSDKLQFSIVLPREDL